MLSHAPPAVHASPPPLLAHRHPAGILRQPLETERDARPLLVFLLLERAGLGGEQFGKREIRLTDAVGLRRVEMIAKKRQRLDAPAVPLRFVLAHVIGQQRRLFGLLLRCPLALVCPPFSPAAMLRDPLVDESSELFA